MMVTDAPINPPLQISEVFRPILTELIEIYPETMSVENVRSPYLVF